VIFLIVIALCLALVGTLVQIRDWYASRRQRIAECAHRWTYYSAWGDGGYWNRRCCDCPKREPVALEDVPAEWKWRSGLSVIVEFRLAAPRATRAAERRRPEAALAINRAASGSPFTSTRTAAERTRMKSMVVATVAPPPRSAAATRRKGDKRPEDEWTRASAGREWGAIDL
jgi:hypothetical protein